MRIFKNGVILRVTDTKTQYSCKVSADSWICPRCDNKVYSGFSTPVFSYHDNYKNLETDVECEF